MIPWRPLEIEEEYAALGEEGREKAELLRRELRETFSTRGFQVVLYALREIEIAALERIAAGDRPEYNAGQIGAIEAIKKTLRDNSAEQLDFVDELDEGLVTAQDGVFPERGEF